MTSGQVILVLGQSRGDLIIYDKTCTDNRAHVPMAQFEPFFAGLVVRARSAAGHSCENPQNRQCQSTLVLGPIPTVLTRQLGRGRSWGRSWPTYAGGGGRAVLLAGL